MFKYSGQSCYILYEMGGASRCRCGAGTAPAARAGWACAPATGIVSAPVARGTGHAHLQRALCWRCGKCWALAVYSESLDKQATVRVSAETIIEQSNHRN